MATDHEHPAGPEGRDPSPTPAGREGATSWVISPPSARSRVRPRWAVPVFIGGSLCSLAVAAISAAYFADLARGSPPSVGLVYTMMLAPFLLAALPLMLVGGLAMVRPWSAGRWWLDLLVIFGVPAWLLFMMAAPGLLPY